MGRRIISPVMLQISAARVRQGITQQGLADRAGFARCSVWRWEQGKVSPRLADAEALAAALGLQITVQDKAAG